MIVFSISESGSIEKGFLLQFVDKRMLLNLNQI